ncbi:TetR/AcrR family transcriptional regulator [Nitrospina gracilis]|uniref:TetR/AcrR family transcriptional regulator n=1 Tax=Nitrospina gracilis TaxID=35801 RepID=UPI001F43874D|nr:TetR/AcrR family transcriptional regulator [Nitrospina gracilis]MCF8719882.1 AcrR family transcriptional regulator [Nitrospina gracilis Nb-211]
MKRSRSNAKDKIVQAASDLFYQQGYQATTIDQVIEKSGVSRPTVYTHFSTKEDLCLVYLKNKRKEDLETLQETMLNAATPKARYMGPMNYVRDAMLKTDYRGCGYFNLISEFPGGGNKLVNEARVYIDAFRELISEGVKHLKSSDPKYKTINVKQIADTYYLILCGAIMAGQEYRESWPLDRAVKAIGNLIEE